MATGVPPMTSEKLEEFIAEPLKLLKHPDEDVEPLGGNTWRANFIRWLVPFPHDVSCMVATAEQDELKAFSLNPERYLKISMDVNAGRSIQDSSNNTYQNCPRDPDYLEMMEVFRRTEVLEPRPGGVIIMGINKNNLHLQSTSGWFLQGVNHCVTNVLDFLPSSTQEKVRFVYNTATLDLIAAKIQKAHRNRVLFKTKVDLIMSDCTSEESGLIKKRTKEAEVLEFQRSITTIGLAMKILVEGRNLILEVNCSNNGYFASCMYLLSRFFKEVSFLKPIAAVDSKMKIYVTAKGFQPHHDDELQVDFLNTIDKFARMKTNMMWYPVDYGKLPRAFLNKLGDLLQFFMMHVASCKNRNVVISKSYGLINHPQIKRYQYKAATNWIFDLQLEQIYYASRGDSHHDENKRQKND